MFEAWMHQQDGDGRRTSREGVGPARREGLEELADLHRRFAAMNPGGSRISWRAGEAHSLVPASWLDVRLVQPVS